MNIKYERFVLAGQLLSVNSALYLKSLSDTSDALLFCQLYADLKTQKFDAPFTWYSLHEKAMHELKWASSYYQRRAFEPADDAAISFEWLIKQGTSSHPETQGHFKELLRCIAILAPTDHCSTLFQRFTVKVRVEKPGHSTFTLQLSALDGVATLTSLFMTFTTTAEAEPDVYRQVFSPDKIVGEIDLRFSTHNWDVSGYQSVRKKVQSFLVGKKDGLILPLLCTPALDEGDE